MGLLDGKVALITGAGRGVGRGIARGLARAGAAVVIAEISEEHGEKAAAEIRAEITDRALFVHTDVRRKNHIRRCHPHSGGSFGGLDTTVNNAIALSPNILLEHKSDDMLDGVLKSGLWAPGGRCAPRCRKCRNAAAAAS